MAASGDLINFDIIEAQKENIQALPSGRSAKKLAEAFSPSPLHKLSTPTPTGSKNVTDCIRAEYEAEIANISESDDPLDVYDRFVRWTFDAYPSAQATPQSQLHTLLERATKAFITSAQYKNDPRYLKLWILFIQFFADAPRETFLFISRHNIGESLALFYEEYAAWLESAGRWAQAEEVYKLGIERGARPEQRLMRKFNEFEQRRAAQGPEATAAPSSPALPAMRPALAAKVDPYAAAAAAAAAAENPQAPRPGQGVGGPTAKPGKAKMAIFSDASAEPSALSARPASSEGWDTIDSLANRKKENVTQAKPWVGETMKAGGKKSSAPKMQIFKDTSKPKVAETHTLVPSTEQVVVNPVSGKRERVFVDLEAVYPAPELPGSELSFEEVWAMNRGWLDHSWEEHVMMDPLPEDEVENLGHMVKEKLTVYTETVTLDENGNIQKKGKSKKTRTMEFNETQIIKANLDSPSKPTKLKKRNATAEPTMTLHTKAATDDIYEIFNQPLKPTQPLEDEEEEEDESDEDDYETDGDGDYTSGAESTMTTTRQVDTSEAGEDDDDEPSDVKSVSEWSDFSTRRHVPGINEGNEVDESNDTQVSNLIDINEDENSLPSSRDPTGSREEDEQEPSDLYEEDDDVDDDLQTPIDEDYPPRTQTVFVPIPPEDYEPRTRPYRDPVEAANNRLPFMTPITERTESSLGVLTARRPQMSPTKKDDNDESDDDDGARADQLFSSPLREIYNDAQPARVPQPILEKPKPKPLGVKTIPPKGPVITDPQCNPVDDVVRNEILAKMHPPLSSYAGFFDHQAEKHGKGSEIRKVAKLMAKARSSGERTSNAFSVVEVEFPDTPTTYTIRKELGAGAFAPVYLVENSTADQEDEDQENNGVAVMGRGAFAVRQRSTLEALKMEQPPSAWEFHMIRLAHSRVGPQHRAAASLTYAHEMHLYQDEGFLLLPLHPHGSLLDVVNLFRAEPSAVMDEQLGMFFTIELMRTIEALHARGVLHGDLKPDNCLLRLDNGDAANAAPLATQYRADGTGGWAARGVVLIDFGRGIDMRNFGPDTQFVADWKTGAHDCAEMREGRPWTWQIDYHGLAGVIYCLLFGRYIETVRCDQGGIGAGGRRYRIKESLKRYWQTEIWGECFDLLLNPGSFVDVEEGQKMPILRGLKQVRERMEAWLEENCERGVGLKSLVGKVEAHARARR
ncbi:checkpoint serine/threonine-protein kinase BUB1 [Verticillium dahliae]|nr:checkpoint serine/threonine-protein kinase BUB1 [Verticillium dahliae]PNH51104.1 hypothetical protein VD0003_g6118 [Verticillium dahliae]